MAHQDRYKEFERTMTAALLGNTLLFIAYLIAAAAGIGWLKWCMGIASLALPVPELWMLHLSKELTKPRSLWLSCGFFAIFCCTLASLILGYPG